MPFLLRQTTQPTLGQITAIPQIVIIDKTGPVISVGASNKACVLVGEFIKGPFVPTEITGPGDLFGFFGGLVAPSSNLPIISQNAISAGTQDGSGVGFNGNGIAQLKGRSFRRLFIQRVDCDAVTTSGGTTKGTIAITVNGTPTPTTSDIVVPAGTRFADGSSPTIIVATSQDYTVPKGSTLPAVLQANVFFVKGTTIGIGGLASPLGILDPAIPSAPTTVTITAVNNSTTLFPPGAGANLSALHESQYPIAIDKTQPNDSTQDINVIWAARQSLSVRQYLAAHVITSSSAGPGRTCVVAADPAADGGALASASAAKTAALALSATEGYTANDRLDITFPHVKIFAAELAQNITINPASVMASILSTQPEEINPGAANTNLTSSIQAYEDAFITSPLVKQDYVNLKAKGISALQKDRSVGWWFVDGVTAVDPAVLPTRVPIKRRRMADMIQDQLFLLAAPYLKQPATTDRVDAFVGEIETYLSLLKSIQNPSFQRIVDYRIDPKSQNTAALQKLGIQTILVAVQTLPGMDFITLNTVIGETVSVSEASA